jgi:acyl-CoA synthetase (AMP-forming)/AMP-acid ligase II
VSDNKSIIGKDEIKGEVQIHTPHAMKGYLHNSLATSEAFTSDGWVRTGDVGYVKEGNWYIIDRTKDIIKVRGWQVSPAEIEAALLEHHDVLDAGVIGVPEKDGCGETPFAFVVRKEGSDLKEDGVKEFLSGRLARYKNVEQVQFVERIPRNPTGKILRRLLKDSRESKEETSLQAAAKAYAIALQGLDAYKQSQTPIMTMSY